MNLCEMTKEELCKYLVGKPVAELVNEHQEELIEATKPIDAGVYQLPTIIITTTDGFQVNTGLTHEDLIAHRPEVI